MNDKEVMIELTEKVSAALGHFQSELNKLRTGRAHPSMVEGVMVDAYGVPTPIVQVASISAPEPQLIQISPFDPSTMEAISTAIRSNQSLGLNPSDDGRIIRIQIPALTTERRQQIAKQLNEKQEDANIGLRKARHDAIDTINKAKKDKTIGEDDAKRMLADVDAAINKAKTDIEQNTKAKEQEIMTV